MASLGPGRPCVLQGKYKHLMPEDRLVWERFIRGGEDLPEQVWFDVLVGRGVEVAHGQPPWMRRMAEYATKKRIDVVARWGVDYMVIECKPHAGIVALGQVIYYGWAFEREYVHEGDVLRGIITDVVDEDVGPVIEEMGIWVVQVGRGGELEMNSRGHKPPLG